MDIKVNESAERETGRERQGEGEREDKMIETYSSPSQMIPTVEPWTRTQSSGKRKASLLFLDMWEVDLPQKVGPREKKGVFLSFMPSSSYESGLALGSTLIAGGLPATWGPGAYYSGPCEGHRLHNE